MKRLCDSNRTKLDGELIVLNLLRQGVLDVPLTLNYALHYAVSNKENRLYTPIAKHKELIQKGRGYR